MTRSTLFPAVFALLVFAGLGAYLYMHPRDASPADTPALFSEAVLQASEGSVATSSAPVPAVPPGSPWYRDPDYHFSFSYPAGFSPKAIDDSGARVITLTNASGAGLQIMVSPYDEPAPLTAARITQDLPDLPMEDVRSVTLNGGTQALAFLSSGGAFGDSVEAWFVRGKALYQVSAYRSQAALVQQVVGTLSF